MFIEIDLHRLRMYKIENEEDLNLEDEVCDSMFLNVDDLTEWNGQEWVKIN